MTDRRGFLKSGALVASAFVVPSALWQSARASDGDWFFSLGVASGMPHATSVVIWTRLAPLGGGTFRAGFIGLRWEVADDEAFTQIVAKGNTTVDAGWGFSAHVEVEGLRPERWYFYRFMKGDAISPVGRTRTAPASDEGKQLRFILGSCQNYQHGYFSALDHARMESPDLMVWVGDYIYEYGSRKNSVRQHPDGECFTLGDYRRRYELYKREAPLQRLHAACPWLVTWDDHEVANDYANDRAEDLSQPDFLARRAAAYQAWYEHMPVRNSLRPAGPNATVYGALDFGALARFHVMDDRQYRSYQPCPPAGHGGSSTVGPECTERLRSDVTMLGGAQEAWLRNSLADSPARWNILTQQTLMCYLDQDPAAGGRFWTDGWNGYPAARDRLLNDIVASKVSNPVVLGGDVHAHYVDELRLGPRGDGTLVAPEFCGTSITSRGAWGQDKADRIAAYNPHVKYSRVDKRGYISFTVGPDKLRADLRAIDNAESPTTTLSTLCSFEVKAGSPELVRVG
jgi:alkaline phosphatase D